MPIRRSRRISVFDIKLLCQQEHQSSRRLVSVRTDHRHRGAVYGAIQHGILLNYNCRYRRMPIVVIDRIDRSGNPVRSSLPFSCLEHGDGSDKLFQGASKASFMVDKS